MNAMYITVNGPQAIQNAYDAGTQRELDTLLCFLPPLYSITSLADRAEETRQVDLLFSTWGMPALTAEQLQTYFPRLQAVFYAAGSVQAFARPLLERGIQVFSAWAANGVPVAEYAFAQILLANKGFYQGARLYSGGNHAAAQRFCAQFAGTYHTKVGLLGAGMIGKLVIERLHSVDVEICVFDPFLSDAQARSLRVELCSLDEVFCCPVVSNHLANNANTRGMIAYPQLARMPDNGTFINTGRGAQVVEADLARILSERPAMTAVLDVTDPEPVAAGSPLYALPNVVLTPHIAGSMGREVARMGRTMAEQCRALLEGRPTRYQVTPDMLATMA